MTDSILEMSAAIKPAPRAEHDEVEIQVTSGETLKVKYSLLMLSPVIRDATRMHASSSGQVPEKIEIKLDCSLSAAKWFFGVLEGRKLEELLRETGQRDQPFSATLDDLRQALRLADSYDIPFFSRLLNDFIFSHGFRTGGTANPLIAFAIGIDLGNVRLARFAVKRMDSKKSPIMFNKLTARALGLDAWWCLVHAYRQVTARGIQWQGDSNDWHNMANAIALDATPVTR